ncbi:MAG: GNAT family N-acetyltransferase [Myxococcota bacterium]|nr:GNAT family N-acetyltransferase [Myxococcota bacterium]
MSGFVIEPVGTASTQEIAGLLGRAFAENPLTRACLGRCTAQERLARVTALKAGLVDAARRKGTIELVRDGSALAGAQLSFAPGAWPLDPRAWISMARGALGTGWRGIERYVRYDQHVGRLHPKAPHFYLWVLGVEPRAQGRGIGAALLRTVIERADSTGAPTYLETDRESSVRLYQRHGFEIERELRVPSFGDLRTWTMLRQPR